MFERKRGMGCARSELLAQKALPAVRFGLGVENVPAPHPVGVEVFLEIATGGPQGSIGVSFPATRQAGTFSAFEGERLAPFHAGAAAKAGRTAIIRRQFGIAPEQQALGSGPDAVKHAVAAVLS